MAQSRTEIANYALIKIGEKTISDIDDDTIKTARICKRYFDQVVREVGRTTEWNCLKTRVILAPLTSTPDFEWDYKHQLPSNCIRVIEILNEYKIPVSYEINGDKILSDTETIQLTYLNEEKDTTIFDPLFVDCVVTLLAAYISRAIKGSDDTGRILMQEYEQVVLPRARTTDRRERRRRRSTDQYQSPLISSRITSTNG